MAPEATGLTCAEAVVALTGLFSNPCSIKNFWTILCLFPRCLTRANRVLDEKAQEGHLKGGTVGMPSASFSKKCWPQ